jgi:hypothetical protein
MSKKKVLRSSCRTQEALHASSWSAQNEEVFPAPDWSAVLKFWFVHCDRVCPKQRSTNENQEECDKVSLNDPEILAASASKPHQVG